MPSACSNSWRETAGPYTQVDATSDSVLVPAGGPDTREVDAAVREIASVFALFTAFTLLGG